MATPLSPVEDESGSYSIRCFKWDVTIGSTPETVPRGSDRTFATFTTSTCDEFDLTLRLKLSSSASSKLLWRNVYCTVELRDKRTPERGDSTSRGGSGQAELPAKVEVQVQAHTSTHSHPPQVLRPTEVLSWPCFPNLDPKPNIVTVRVRVFQKLTQQKIALADAAILARRSFIEGDGYNDVAFYISSCPERPLFSNKASLAAASTYFRAMFGSGFIESAEPEKQADVVSQSAAPSVASSPRIDDLLPFPFDFSGHSAGPSQDIHVRKRRRTSEETEVEYKGRTEIDVEDTDYDTFRALLVYFATGEIYFTPLASQIGQVAFDGFLSKYESDHPHGPPPISPMDMYRLADRYDVEELRKRCLAQLRLSLVTSHLSLLAFTDECYLFDEIKELIHGRIISNWHAISTSDGWKEALLAVEEGEHPFAASLLASLMLRLAGRGGQTAKKRRGLLHWEVS